MNQINFKCDQGRLKEAIANTLGDAEEVQLAQHLCECQSCRERLSEFAGDDSFWMKATSNLAASASFRIDTASELHSSIFVKIDRNALSNATIATISSAEHSLENTDDPFEPPTHPEMLGRIDGFSIEQMIGRGGMGVVYKGFDAELNRPVAIKFLAPHLSVSGVARKRFAREAQAAAAVVHPNVVPIYSIGTSKKRPYIVMALVSGRSLQKHVEESGPLPAEDIVRIAQQIAAGLSAAHEQGLVHRDIKPANIMLEKDVSRVLITDFGLARAADDAGLTQSGWLAGTPHYMSPEQTKGDDVDHRSDLFSLGSVMYFMSTGREPFRAENPYAVLQKIGSKGPASARSINSQVPKTLDDLILKLLQKDPSDRLDSASSVQEVLTQYLAWLQNPTQHLKPQIKRTMKRGWLFKASLATMMGLISIFVVLQFADFYFDSTSSPEPSFGPINRSTKPSSQPTTSATPSWISGLPSAQRWDADLTALRNSVEQMEQPSISTKQLHDSFESEQAELEGRIRAMESSLGIQDN